MQEKEKHIEEIAQDICGYCTVGGVCILDGKKCDLKCTHRDIAEQVYNAGYRKVDDIFEDIFEGRLEVVNKRSGDKLKKASDVAEEIFAEIEKKIDLELSIIRKIIHAKGGRANGKTVLLGKIQMLIDLKNFIAELKKKYIGKDTNVTTKESEKGNG